MRAFAQKSMTAQQAVPARSTISGRTHLGRNREVGSILHLGRQALQRMPLKDGDKKAELEFHNTLAFNTRSGSSSTGPSQEGFAVLEIQWTVLNSGWETAPEHVDRLTVYKVGHCSGCRDKNEEIINANATAPATAPGSKYESNGPILGMNLEAGHYVAYVDLDVDDDVDEINKDNNTLFTSWYVAPRKEPEPPE